MKLLESIGAGLRDVDPHLVPGLLEVVELELRLFGRGRVTYLILVSPAAKTSLRMRRSWSSSAPWVETRSRSSSSETCSLVVWGSPRRRTSALVEIESSRLGTRGVVAAVVALRRSQTATRPTTLQRANQACSGGRQRAAMTAHEPMIMPATTISTRLAQPLGYSLPST